MHVGTQFEAGAVPVVNKSREEHWSELDGRLISCPGFRLPTRPVNGDGIGRALRGEAVGRGENPVPGLAGSQLPPTIISEGLFEGDGMLVPKGLWYRGQNSITEWAFPEGHSRRFVLLSRETGVLLSCLAEPFSEQRGVCHILVIR